MCVLTKHLRFYGSYRWLTLSMLRENRARERFPKAPKTFRAWKTYRKTPTCIFCKDGLFIFCIKEIKIKTTAKFHTSRRLRSEDKRRIMSPEKFWDFRETGKATGKTTGRQATGRPLMIYIFLTRVPTNLTKGLRLTPSRPNECSGHL